MMSLLLSWVVLHVKGLVYQMKKIHAEINIVNKDGYLNFVEVTISDWRGE